MKALVVPFLRILDNWATQRIVRVAVFGQGLALSEWDSLSTSAYAYAIPRLRCVDDPSDAHIMAIHGPITLLSWPMLQAWVTKARYGARFIAVGAEIEVNDEGHIIGPHGELSSFKVLAVLSGHPPSPASLISTVKTVMELPHV